MTYLRPKLYSKFNVNGRQQRALLYLFLLGTVLLLLVPWSMLLNPLNGLVAGFILLAGVVIWMQLRLNFLHARMRRMEHQLSRLTQQRATNRLNQQVVSHFETDRLFSQDQTRH